MSDFNRLVVIGYGNPSRGDDALGPELLRLLAEHKARRCRLPGSAWNEVELITDFQLQIEHALDLEQIDVAMFVDASVACPSPHRCTPLRAERDASYTSHAMSPAAVLHVYEQINRRPAPQSFLLSIRGEQFALGDPLSDVARDNLASAYGFLKHFCDHCGQMLGQRASVGAAREEGNRHA